MNPTTSLNFVQAISTLIVFAVLCLCSNVVQCHYTNMEKELILTQEEKIAFDRFKSHFPNYKNWTGFMKHDLFLLRWIRGKDLDVKLAVRDMNEYLEWRKTNRIDTIQQEDWSDMVQDHPYRMDVVDLQGRPVAVGSIGGQWNIRRSAIQGKLPRLSRYAFKLVEEVFDRTYQINHKHPNITQFSVIVSLEGFNLFQQGCPLCLSTYIQLLTIYNRFYPNFAHAIIAINTPVSFNVVLDLVRPMLNKGTNEALRIYGYNQKQWKPVLDNEVSEDQMPREFGGTRPEEDYDFKN